MYVTITAIIESTMLLSATYTITNSDNHRNHSEFWSLTSILFGLGGTRNVAPSATAIASIIFQQLQNKLQYRHCSAESPRPLGTDGDVVYVIYYTIVYCT